MYIADGKNERIYHIVTAHDDGDRHELRRRRPPAGQWFAVHSIAIDSKGNSTRRKPYEGRRLQKFVYKGEQMVPRWQGVPWPVKK